jgi:PAS domain S-box-containing protein
MKPGFLEKLLKRLDRLDPAEVQHYLLRLVQEQGFFQKVFEALQEGLILLDKDRVVTYVNGAAAGFFGVHRADLVGRRLGEGIRGLDFDSGFESGAFVSRDLEVTYPERRFLNFYLSPIGAENDLGFVLLIRDITGTRKSTEEMIESDRLSTLSLLAASVAHELGNPLNSLTIHLQLLERRLRKSKSRELDGHLEVLRVAQDEVQRLDKMILSFLGAIRPSSPNFERLDVNSSISEAASFLKPEFERNGVQVILDLGSSLPDVRADRDQMRQVFLNLLRNGSQAMPGGGLLTVTSAAIGAFVTVSFRDTGIGIGEAQFSGLFRPYFSTRSGGTGLGLLVVRRIIREHGGEIEIHSKVQSGTVVSLTLPLFDHLPARLSAVGSG